MIFPTTTLPTGNAEISSSRTRDVAKRLGMSYWTLRDLWLAGKGPRQRVLTERIKGSTVGDIEDYLDTCIVS